MKLGCSYPPGTTDLESIVVAPADPQGPCPEPAVTGGFVESSIAKQLQSVSIDPAFADWLLKVIERDWAEEPPLNGTIESAQAATEKELDDKVERLLEMRISGELTKDEFQRHRSQLEGQRHTLRTAAERDAAQRRSLKSAIRFGSGALDHFQRDDMKLKRQIASTFATSYVLTQGELKITPHPLLSRIVALEPPKRGRDKVGKSASGAKSPLEWSQGDSNPRSSE